MSCATASWTTRTRPELVVDLDDGALRDEGERGVDVALPVGVEPVGGPVVVYIGGADRSRAKGLRLARRSSVSDESGTRPSDGAAGHRGLSRCGGRPGGPDARIGGYTRRRPRCRARFGRSASAPYRGPDRSRRRRCGCSRPVHRLPGVQRHRGLGCVVEALAVGDVLEADGEADSPPERLAAAGVATAPWIGDARSAARGLRLRQRQIAAQRSITSRTGALPREHLAGRQHRPGRAGRSAAAARPGRARALPRARRSQTRRRSRPAARRSRASPRTAGCSCRRRCPRCGRSAPRTGRRRTSTAFAITAGDDDA